MKLRYIASAIVACTMALTSAAQDCTLHLCIGQIDQEIPDAVAHLLETRLQAAVSENGVAADDNFTQFFVAVKADHIYRETLPGPPRQDAVHTMLTFYIGDMNDKKVFASTSFEVRGVGEGEQRAYINALKNINGANQQIRKFLQQGRQKVISYYDKNYQQILAKAARAAQMHEYAEALYYVSSVPECSQAYDKVAPMVMKYYQMYIDYDAQLLLRQAQNAWAQHPDAQGAAEAMALLNRIEVGAACESQAAALAREIASKIRSDWTFENRQKYNDQLDLQKRNIEAARAVGVAWGSHQPSRETVINWIR